MNFKIKTLILALVAASIPLFSIIPMLLIADKNTTERGIQHNLDIRGQEIAGYLSHSLYNQWIQIQTLAEIASVNFDNETLRLRLDTIQQVNPQFSWIGIANKQGVVETSTGKILEGQSVKQRPWFQYGIVQPYAGDVHEALLLQQYLEPLANEPLRLLDFATPVRRADGSIRAVIGAHTNWMWLKSLVSDISTPTAELIVMSKDGVVQIGPPDIEHKFLDTESAKAARSGKTKFGVEIWPNGELYVVNVVPKILYKDLPDFGWSIIIREHASFIENMKVNHGNDLIVTCFASVLVFIFVFFGSLYVRKNSLTR